MLDVTRSAPEKGGAPYNLQESPPLALVVRPSQETHERWLRYLSKEKGLSPNTVKLYGRTLEKAAHDLGPLENLGSETLRTWLHSQKGCHGTTANRLCALTSYYKYLVRTDVRPDCPTDKLDRPKARRGLPKPVEDIESVLKRLDKVDERAIWYGNPERKVGESRAMATILAETGLRIHEAVGLEVPLPVPNSITIIGKGNKEAIVLLNSKARSALENLGGRWPVGARATQRRFEKAGIHPHALRHTFATNLVRKGVEIGTVSKLCRHSSPTVTMVYAQYDETIMRAAIGD